MKLFNIFRKKVNTKDEIKAIVDKIKSHENNYELLSSDELRNKTFLFKKTIYEGIKELVEQKKSLLEEEKLASIDRLKEIYEEIKIINEKIYRSSEKTLNEIQFESYAVVKEVARRFTNNKEIIVRATNFDIELSKTNDYIEISGNKSIWKTSWMIKDKYFKWNMIHYDVQLYAGYFLHFGKIIEMMNGEGKTLVSTLPIYLNALTGNGVHVISINDYLSHRDMVWMAPIFQFLGLTIDCINLHDCSSNARKKAYQSDITYGTKDEFVFDYLRDNMVFSSRDVVQRPLNYAIIDEVDSVLIDDARTPLNISGSPSKVGIHEFKELEPLVNELVNIQKKELTKVLAESKDFISLNTEESINKGAVLLYQVYRGLPKDKELNKFLNQDGVKQLLQQQKKLFTQFDNLERPKVDKNLYFISDEKDKSVSITKRGTKYLSSMINKINYFNVPDIYLFTKKIDQDFYSKEEKIKLKKEFYNEYNTKSERIKTINVLLKAHIFFTKDIEYVVVDKKVKIVDEITGRIREGSRYSDGLHQAIEAKEDVKIEDNTETLATVTSQNYFRMYNKISGMSGTVKTDINEFKEIYNLEVIEIPTNSPIRRIDEQDIVYKTKREKYNAIIDKIIYYKKQNRPVLIGTSSVETSELISRMLKVQKIEHKVLNAKLHEKESDIISTAGNLGAVTIATNMAGRGTDIKLSQTVKEIGGLSIIGSGRHESRRIDWQLRGRSGRQGAPGSSQFYVSLEDSLMRLFGSERIAKMMDRMGLKEGEVIQHSMISASIERAQKKVEENNLDIRRRLLNYDDVINTQRKDIYKRRHNALFEERLRVDLTNMIFDTSKLISENSKKTNDFKNFEYELISYFSISSPITEDVFTNLTAQEIAEKIYKTVLDYYKEIMEHNAELAYPIVKNVYENQGDRYKRIVAPFTDGVKILEVITDLEKAYESKGKQLVTDFERNITLIVIDAAWQSHLTKMDNLKSLNTQYMDKDPLLVYKSKSIYYFDEMLKKINKEVLTFLFKAELPNPSDSEEIEK